MPQVNWKHDVKVCVPVPQASDDEMTRWRASDDPAAAAALAAQPAPAADGHAAPAASAPTQPQSQSQSQPQPPALAEQPKDAGVCASEDSASWNSFVHWARAHRGPQWDTGTGMCVLS